MAWLHDCLDFSGGLRLGEHLLRGADGRHIDHLAFKRKRADALRLLRLMRLYEPPGISDLFVARREDRLDNFDMFGVDGGFAAKAQLRAEASIFDQGGFVVEVDDECVNGLQAVSAACVTTALRA